VTVPPASGAPAADATPAPDPPPAPGDAKRRRILEAARSLCARDGYEAATMEAIAAASRVSKGTLYNFFESKEHLFLATQLEAYEEVRARVDARVGERDAPRARVDALLDALVEVFPVVAAGMSVNLQVWAVVSRTAEARTRMYEALRHHYADHTRALRQALLDGRRDGSFRDDFDLEAVVTAVSALFDGLVYRSIFDPGNASAARLRELFAGLVHERVLRPPAGAPGGGAAGTPGRQGGPE